MKRLVDCSEISLGDFEPGYFEDLPGSSEVISPGGSVVYHNLLLNGNKVGVVGYMPTVFPPDSGFVQIVIHPDYRGRGFVECAYKLLSEHYNLKNLFATIDRKNIRSIRAHQKIGFELLTQGEMAELKRKGLLKEGEIRLKKEI